MKPLTAAATGMTNIKLGSTFLNDQLPEMRFDLQFVNPPDGCEWSKDFVEKNRHDGTVVENELATAIMNLALRGIVGGGIGQSPRRERV